MNYWKKVIIVTRWEFSRFFKPKNEAIGILVMLVVSVVFYLGGKYAFSNPDEKIANAERKMEISVLNGMDETFIEAMNDHYAIKEIQVDRKQAFIRRLKKEEDGVLLEKDSGVFTIHAFKNTSAIEKLKIQLTEFHKQTEMKKIGLTPENLNTVMTPVRVVESFVYIDNSRYRSVLAYFFAALMVMAVFLSFAYQFTAITGEKQLKITEQIVSAISPQVWMDGKIFGITLIGVASIFTYTIFSIIGAILFFQFKGRPITGVLNYLDLSPILLYLPFALAGILIWNAVLAAIASVITNPNTSGKSSLMMLPVIFVIASVLVTRDPDNEFSIFLSWFPLTSATAMPIRWATTTVGFWEITGSFLLLALTFYFLRKLAAKIFRVSILITGKEPSFSEVYKLAKES